MSLVAVCGCGARFEAKPHLAGQTIACPTCGQPLIVPKQATPPPRPAAAPSAAALTLPTAAAPKRKSARSVWIVTACVVLFVMTCTGVAIGVVVAKTGTGEAKSGDAEERVAAYDGESSWARRSPINGKPVGMMSLPAHVDVSASTWNAARLRDNFHNDRRQHANRLLRISLQSNAREDLELFRKMLNRDENALKFYAALALLNWREDTDRMIDVVIQCTKRAQRSGRQDWMTAVDPQLSALMFAAFGAELKPNWVRRLDDRDPFVQSFAIAQLGQLGDGAKDQLERLERMAGQGSESEVRRAAKRALERIQDPATAVFDSQPKMFKDYDRELNFFRGKADGWTTFEPPDQSYSVQIPKTPKPPHHAADGSFFLLDLEDGSRLEIHVQPLRGTDPVKYWKAASQQLGNKVVSDRPMTSPAKSAHLRRFYVDDVPRAQCLHLSSGWYYMLEWTGQPGGEFSPDIDKFFSSFRWNKEYDPSFRR